MGFERMTMDARAGGWRSQIRYLFHLGIPLRSIVTWPRWVQIEFRSGPVQASTLRSYDRSYHVMPLLLYFPFIMEETGLLFHLPRG